MEIKEPYRATRLWNEVIEAFQSGMPLKKHRRRIQVYNNCFTASEAVTWLHCYLMNNPNFGKDVTRQQSVNLLQKFLKCHVIESVVIRSKKKGFADDSHLYRFSSLLTNHTKPSALCLIQSPSFGVRMQKVQMPKGSPKHKSPLLQKENLPECHIVVRKLSQDEVKLMWKRVTVYRLEKLLSFSSVADILDEKMIDGHVIKHNVCRLSKTGVVCLLDKTDDIPSWVISAMKCLANWPNASGSGSCLPNYPGFEKDVFKVVRDFFLNPQVPLIPDDLTLPLIKVFCHFTQQKYIDPIKEGGFHENQSISSQFSCSSKEASRCTPSDQVKTSTPLGPTEAANFSHFQGNNVQDETSHGKLLLDDPEVMWEYPSAAFYETDFATSDPVTRVVSDGSVSRGNSCCNSVESINSVSTISMCSQNESVHSGRAATSPMKAWSSNLYLQDRVKESASSPQGYSSLQVSASNSRICGDQRSPSFAYMDEDVYSYEINDLDMSNLSAKTVVEVNLGTDSGSVGENLEKVDSASILSTRSSSQSNQTPYQFVNRSFKKDILITQELKLSFQLILLLLPSANRRQLHLLLRLLNKVIKNGKFVLNVKCSMRDYLLETFLPAIIQSEDNQTILFQMASFLLEDCEFLFQTPVNMKEEVEDLSRSCYGRIKYSVDDTCFLSYCEMVSKQKYEDQKLSASVEALRDLLNKILQDPKISEKEKRKKIKQFKEIHPEVYHLQFPDKEEFPLKSKQSLFSKLSNLRI